jgi:hypothetical protein|tara:strand:- start:1725 stop:2210 length:486 start_codon:yes stop_codon:yes gene_type:complete
MNKNKSNPYGIKTPTSIKEFRENLQKYYLCISNGDYENIEENSLLVKECGGIELNKISSFSEIYEITESGFYGDGSSPSIIPKITEKKDVLEYMYETDQVFSSGSYFHFEENYTLWEGMINHNEFLSKGNPRYFTLDNQHLREFYMMTLGEYSGYGYREAN